MTKAPAQTTPKQQAEGRRWILGIVLGLSAVVAVNGVVAYMAGSVPAELERDDYYLASLSHQNELNAYARAAAKGYALEYRMDRGLVLTQYGQPVTRSTPARLHMARPSDAASDFSTDLAFPLTATVQAELADRLNAGRWQASLTLSSEPVTTTVNASLYIGDLP